MSLLKHYEGWNYRLGFKNRFEGAGEYEFERDMGLLLMKPISDLMLADRAMLGCMLALLLESPVGGVSYRGDRECRSDDRVSEGGGGGG